jgi:hypothetical protein
VTDEKRLDPFKPIQPQIPGVAPTISAEPAEPSHTVYNPEPPPPRNNGRWVAAIVGGVLIVVALFGWWSHTSSATNRASSPSAESTTASGTSAGVSSSAENLPIGPGEVATTEELSKAWSAKRFLFRNPLTSETVPAMVVRLPGGGYWGFSLREPYGSCDMEFVTDLQKLQSYYSFRASHPMVADPCDRTVFDLTQYGTAPRGLVRGEIAQGTAIRPPLAIEIRTNGNQVLAVRME